MALRGENVGTAYVRILADGTGLADDIRDDLEDTDDVFEDAGKRHAEKYDEEFSKQLRRDRPGNQKEITKVFEGHTQRIRQITEEMSTTYFKNLEKNIRNQAGNNERLGDRIVQQLRKGFIEGGGYAQWGKDMKGLFDQMPHWYERAMKEMNDIDRRSNVGEAAKKGLKEIEVGTKTATPRLHRFNIALGGFSDKIGHTFGKGSRNDFLNFFGGMIGFFSSIPAKIGGAIESVANFGKAFMELRKGGATVLASLRGAAGGMGSLGSSAAAAAVAIPIVIVVVGTLVSALSLLLGVVVALASALANALVGALAAVAGALLPVVAAFGVLGAAIAGMSDAQKKMVKEAFQPLIKGFKDIGAAAAESIFGGTGSKAARETAAQFENTIKRMTNALTSSNMKTLVTGIGGAIADVGAGWAKSMDSPGFRRFIDTMAETLPKQVLLLGHIFDRVGAAIGNTFIAMQPLVQNFLKWLDDVVTAWAKWTGTNEGQAEMLGFFDRAQDSLKSVGHFLKEVGGLFKDLLFNATGQETGNTIFDSMADGIAKFRDYIADGGLEKWFKDSKEFAEALGNAIKGIGKVLDALDSEGFRSFATFMIDSFERMAEVIEAVVGPIADFAKGLDQLLHGDFSGAFDTLGDSLSKLPGRILTVMTMGFGDDFLNYFKEVGGNIVQGLWDGIVEAWTGFVEWVGSIPQQLIDAFTRPLGIASPSTVFMQFGRDIIMGLLQGIAELLTLPIQMLVDLAGQMGSAFTTGLGAAFSAVSGMASRLGGALRDGLGSAMSWAGDKARSVGGFFSGAFSSGLGAGKNAAERLGGYLRGQLSSAADNARSAASRLGSVASGALSSGLRAADRAAGAVASGFGKARDGAQWLIDKVQSLIGWLGKIKVPKINWPSPPSWLSKIGLARGGIMGLPLKRMAAGGFANFRQQYEVGESGREAIVPLDRPLGQVDPAVRMLSAFAQGKLGEYNTDNSKAFSADGWIIQSPNDGATVAREVLDALVAQFS